MSRAGVLPVDKPPGPTSHDVVRQARRALGERRVGHTGTLDPFASGLLLLCVGPATRLSEYLTGLDKEYRAVLRLGLSTDSLDRDGATVAVSDAWRGLERGRFMEAVAEQRGTFLQRPPALSAKKVRGEAAHRRVRRGEAVELEPVEVTVHHLEVEAWEPPLVTLRVACSTGTYVRSIARDLGDALGVGAHLAELRRTRVGRFRVDEAVAPERLGDPGVVERAWITPAAAVAHLPRVEIDAEDERRLRHGQPVPYGGSELEGTVALLRDGELVAVGSAEGSRLRPRKVFATEVA